MKSIITFMGALVCILQALAQDIPLIDGKFNYLKRGDYFLEKEAYLTALDAFEKGLRVDSKDSLTYIKRIAHVHFLLGDFDEAEAHYSKMLSEGNADSTSVVRYAEVLASKKKYDQASEILDKIGSQSAYVSNRKKGFARIMDYLSDSLAYSVRPVDFNSDGSDFYAAYLGNTLAFISSRDQPGLFSFKNLKDGSEFLNLYILKGDSILALDVFNDKLNQGPFEFIEHLGMILVTENYPESNRNGDRDNSNPLRLRSYLYTGSGWEEGPDLPFNSRAYSVAHPSFDRTTNTLYYASNMPGSKGTDIYRSTFDGELWSKPENLPINTSGDELYPFIDGENQVLYFSSNGYEGLGGMDIYQTQIASMEDVTNLGYPVNSPRDDFAFTLNQDRKSGYLSSNREGGKGEDDIYSFSIHKVQVKASFVDLETSRPVFGDVKIVSMRTGKEVDYRIAEDVVVFEGIEGEEYRVVSTNPGYEDVVRSISLKDQSHALNLEIPVKQRQIPSYMAVLIQNREPINLVISERDLIEQVNSGVEATNSVIVENLFFPFDESDPIEGKEKLSSVLKVMKSNERLRLIIQGHTDSHGGDEYNELLARQRAASVKKMLVSLGVSENRVSVESMGEMMASACPRGHNCDEDVHLKDRRVEFHLEQILKPSPDLVTMRDE